MSLLRRILAGGREHDYGRPGLYVEGDGDLVRRSTQGGPLVPVGGAGGFEIGSSYAFYDVAAQPGLTADGIRLDVLLTDPAVSAGGDISLNADGHSIDISTTGWYQLSAHLGLSGVMDYFQVVADVASGTDPPQVFAPAAIGGGLDATIASSVMPLPAGFPVSLQAGASAASGLWGIMASAQSVSVVRMA